MFKFLSGALLVTLATTGMAEATSFNQWQAFDGARHVQKAESHDSDAGKHHKKHERDTVRLINLKNKKNKFIIGCRINSGQVHLTSLLSQSPQNMPKGKQKTTLSLAIDDNVVLTNNKARLRRAGRDLVALNTNLNGDETTKFISQFLAAKKSITISSGSGAKETFTAANADKAGLALQNCLPK